MKLKLVLYILLAYFSIVEVKAQDPVFTQYYFVPETQNGAFTGTINTLNTGILHRTQWPDGARRPLSMAPLEIYPKIPDHRIRIFKILHWA